MIIGNDQPVFRNHETRPKRTLATEPVFIPAIKKRIELTQRVFTIKARQPTCHCLARCNADNSGHHAISQFREALRNAVDVNLRPVRQVQPGLSMTRMCYSQT